MATENFIHDLAGYLFAAGNLSDLTLNFRDKSWQIHKALACCHSVWFQKAVTAGFEESHSGVITLKDEPEFANAIDCMVTYFYKAGYEASQYDTSHALLHAQVATIADKYNCPSLYKLARASLAGTIASVGAEDWAAVATFVYDYTTSDLTAHQELRALVVSAVSNRPAVLTSILELDSAVAQLRSTPELAADILSRKPIFDSAKKKNVTIFACGMCQYFHAGPRDCSYLTSKNMDHNRCCPGCSAGLGRRSKSHISQVNLVETFPCHTCGGFHTLNDVPVAASG